MVGGGGLSHSGFYAAGVPERAVLIRGMEQERGRDWAERGTAGMSYAHGQKSSVHQRVEGRCPGQTLGWTQRCQTSRAQAGSNREGGQLK